MAVSMSIATIILLLMGSLGKAMPITSTFFNKEDTFKLDSVFQTGANVEVPQTTKQEESSIKVKKYTN
ncbi:hypothetical protein IR145_14825, partial [Streptococcus danieliae]|nr:hypothetical protein [Streptococcus danieliae]